MKNQVKMQHNKITIIQNDIDKIVSDILLSKDKESFDKKYLNLIKRLDTDLTVCDIKIILISMMNFKLDNNSDIILKLLFTSDVYTKLRQKIEKIVENLYMNIDLQKMFTELMVQIEVNKENYKVSEEVYNVILNSDNYLNNLKK